MNSPDTDHDDLLVERVLAGDRIAFETLYSRYLPRIYAHAQRRIEGREAVERGVEQVMSALFSSLEDYHSREDRTEFAVWVLRLARSLLER